jgi:radical SAM/Cys-rich protein
LDIASEAAKTTIDASFDQCLEDHQLPALRAASSLHTIQVNIGLKCNLTCHHCHVNSSPQRKETMDWNTMEAILKLADELGVKTIDITGGAPEMHPDFKRFVGAIRTKNLDVIVRTNLTILLESGYEDFIEFLREHRVELVASLPCYLEENVDAQRGEGVYNESIQVIQQLNRAGYGIDPDLPLNLIYNPGGPSLPPDQIALEEEYKIELKTRFGIEFTQLHTITNVPIGRFKTDLRKAGALDSYMVTLRDHFNSSTVDPLMCRHQISVGWDGTLYDCDFNLALRMPTPDLNRPNIHSVSAETLLNRCIATGDHCFACTAGAGSSCGGSLV